MGNSLVPLSANISVADTESYSVMQSAQLLGRTITATVTNADGDSEQVTGIVNRVGVLNDQMVAYVDGRAIPLASITEVAVTGSSGAPGGTDTTGGTGADGDTDNPDVPGDPGAPDGSDI